MSRQKYIKVTDDMIIAIADDFPIFFAEDEIDIEEDLFDFINELINEELEK